MKVMIKRILLFILLIFSACLFADSGDEFNKSDESNDFLYILDYEEFKYFYNCYSYLKNWEKGEIKVSDKELAEMYEDQIGKNTFTALLFENFFRNTKNKEIQKQVKKYIQKKKLSDNPFEKALLKKINSTEKEYEQSGKKMIQYSYKDSEFDENINLFDFNEIHPFNDEFGMLISVNDYNILRWKSMETDEFTDDKEVVLIAGGNTNSISIKVKEIQNVKPKSKEEIIRLAKIENISKKYKDNWFFIEVDKTGILSNCGVDNYYIGYGTGPDAFMSEIAAGDFVTCMYKKETGKIYLVSVYMNFSNININYEIRNRLYNTILFYTLFCYCD